MISKVFLAAVAEPDAKGLRNFLFFRFSEAVVERESSVTFEPAGAVSVSIPVAAGNTDAAGGFFD